MLETRGQKRGILLSEHAMDKILLELRPEPGAVRQADLKTANPELNLLQTVPNLNPLPSPLMSQLINPIPQLILSSNFKNIIY